MYDIFFPSKTIVKMDHNYHNCWQSEPKRTNAIAQVRQPEQKRTNAIAQVKQIALDYILRFPTKTSSILPMLENEIRMPWVLPDTFKNQLEKLVNN